MKTITKIAFYSIFILIFTLLATSAYASLDEINLVIEAKEKNLLKTHNESEEIFKIIESREDVIKNALRNIGIDKYQRVDVEKGFDNAYKVHHLKYDEGHPFEMYKLGETFHNLISEDYEWEVPVFYKDAVISTYTISQLPYIGEVSNIDDFSDGQLEIMKKNQDRWDVTLIGNYFPEEGISTFINDKKLSELIRKNGLNNINDLKVVSLPAYFTYIIYFNSNNGEYVIPYTKREELTGLKNSSVYSVSDFIRLLDENIKIPTMESIPDDILQLPSGGFTAASSENTMNYSVDNSILFYLITFIFSILAFLIIFYYKKCNAANG